MSAEGDVQRASAGVAAFLDSRLIGIGQCGNDGRRLSLSFLTQMDIPEFIHEGCPHLRATFFQKPGTNGQFRRRLAEFPAPSADRHHDGKEFNGLLRHAVTNLLLVVTIVVARHQPQFDQPPEAGGKNVGGDPFERVFQQGPVVPMSAEHHVAQDDEAPPVADDLHRLVDGTA